jgi:hypothetical protein
VLIERNIILYTECKECRGTGLIEEYYTRDPTTAPRMQECDVCLGAGQNYYGQPIEEEEYFLASMLAFGQPIEEEEEEEE